MDPNVVRVAAALVALTEALQAAGIEVPDLDPRLVALAGGQLWAG